MKDDQRKLIHPGGSHIIFDNAHADRVMALDDNGGWCEVTEADIADESTSSNPESIESGSGSIPEDNPDDSSSTKTNENGVGPKSNKRGKKKADK